MQMRAKKILYIQYTNPACYPPLEHSSRILADRGWKVFFLGTGSFEKSNILNFKTHPNISVKGLSYCPPGWKQKVHYAWFCFLAFLKTLWWRPQWIYASDPNSCPAALLLNYLPGIKVIYHEHDSPSSGLNNYVMNARKKIAASSKLCVLPNERRISMFTQETGRQKDVKCVWNCPRKDEVQLPKISEKKLPVIIYYHGAINGDHVPITLIKALKTVPDEIILRVVGYETIGSVGYIDKLLKTADSLKIEKDRIEFHAPAPRYQLLKACSDCSVGFAFVPPESTDINNNYKTGASNKPFDYMACGLATLVSDTPEWRKMYVEPGYGLACDPGNPEDIARALHWFLEHPKETREMGERGRQKILSDWNYERQFEPVFDIINKSQRQ